MTTFAEKSKEEKQLGGAGLRGQSAGTTAL